MFFESSNRMTEKPTPSTTFPSISRAANSSLCWARAGSGKTTTLLMIAGFETPSSGVIELDGHNLTLSKPYPRNIGMVFQNYALFPT